MIPLSEPLDTIDFDGLVEIARSRLPILAEEWTDYNYSDPGITLVELLAWIADTQIYSIGRNRADERAAMAALLGIRPQGAEPAAGTLFAQAPVLAPQQVAAGAYLVPMEASAPRIEVIADVTLWPVEIAAVLVDTGTGTVDHTGDNAEPRATYPAFGEPPSDHSVLRLVLDGSFGGTTPVELSLGFELEEDDYGDEARDDGLGGIRIAYVAPDGSEHIVTPGLDTTDGLRRSGAMVLPFVPGAGERHSFAFRASKDTLMPRLARITPNALPVVQRASFAPPAFRGTGRPDQAVSIRPLDLFDPNEAAGEQPWRLVRGADAFKVIVERGSESRRWVPGEFAEAGPDDTCYSASELADGRIEVRFGNGINGRCPSEGSGIALEMVVSAGKGGNVAAGVEWLLAAPRSRWQNREAIGGGKDADDLNDLLAALRARLRSERTLATSRQIEEAALGLPKAYGVERAVVIDGWEPGRRRPASAATRTLIVVREGDGNETPDWCRAIARRLLPRIALAERLIVTGPEWRKLRVRVHASAAPGKAPAAVAERIRKELADRLKPAGRKGSEWPFGQDLTAMAVGGWIRRLPEVGAVREVRLLDESGREIAGGELAIGPGQLPLLVDGQRDDVRVDPGAPR
jgi:hypothetical protein